MPRKKNELTNALNLAPFWVSLVLAGVVYVFLEFILPTITINNSILKGLAGASTLLAPFVALFFILISLISFTRKLRVKKQLDQQKSIDTLNDLSWKHFEDVTGEFFRQHGYTVSENLAQGADGGVDLRLTKEGVLTLVQCKRWKTKKVPLAIVRELLGAMTAESATQGIVITTSTFTADAQAFASKHNIQLIDGQTLSNTITNSTPTTEIPHTSDLKNSMSSLLRLLQ